MRHAWGSSVVVVALVGGLCFGGVGLGISPAEAAPGGGGKTDLTTNIHVIDSSSPPIVVGEVVGFDAGRNVFVALSPALANADPPLCGVAPSLFSD